MTVLYTTVACFVAYFVVTWAVDIVLEASSPIDRAMSDPAKPAAPAATVTIPLRSPDELLNRLR